jgi:hypothetical protein
MRGERTSKRFTHWTDKKLDMVYDMAKVGFSEAKMAEYLDVSIGTFIFWKKNHKEFRQALNDGKLGADTMVVNAFLQCCVGYEYEEQVAIYDRKDQKFVTTNVKKQRPPDVWAALKWMQNKNRDEWSETQRIQVDFNANISHSLSASSTDFLLALEKEAKRLTGNITDIEEVPPSQLPENAGDSN